MKKVRTLVAAALLAVPALVLSAAQVPDGHAPVQAQADSKQAAGLCCWIQIMGRWFCIPC
jgi:hypothetical protein